MKGHTFVFFLLMFVLFITMGGVGLIIPIMPSYIETFGGGGQVIGILVSLFALGQFIFSPIAGTLSDKIGRKPLIITGLFLYGISNLMFGTADALWVLFIARFLSGVGAAFTLPPIMAFIADITTIENRGKGMAMMGASISLGFTIGPALGGFLSTISLTFPLILSGSLSLLCGILCLFVLKDNHQKSEIKTKAESFISQMVSSTKKSYFSFLVIAFIFCFGITNFQSTASIFLDNKFNYTPSQIAMVFTVGGLFGVLLQVFVVDKFFKKFGEENIMVISLLFAALAMLCMIFVSGYFLVIVVSSLFFIATTFTRPAVNTLISKNAEGEQGYAAGVMNAYMSLGTMIAPLFAGFFFEWNINSPFVIGAVTLFISFIVSHILNKKKKNKQ